MTKRKTPPNGDGASPNNVRVSAKLPRKTMHKFMYHVQGLDQEGKVIRSRLYTREYAAMEYAENLLQISGEELDRYISVLNEQSSQIA